MSNSIKREKIPSHEINKKTGTNKNLYQKTIIEILETITRSYYPIDAIEPNPWNVNIMTTEEFESLKESIKITKGEYLKKNPIKIWKDREKDKYIISDGEHRWRACKELGFKKIPADLEIINIEEAKSLNVIYSKNRGKTDYFKLSKLLNEEYYKEDGKRKCTQQNLAERFGLSGKREVSDTLKIYPRLKNFFDQSPACRTFSTRQLIAFSRCNDILLRGKLIEESLKNKWSSKEIRKQATKFNKLSKWINKEIKRVNVRECLINIFTGTSLFTLQFEELIEKFFHFVIENKWLKIIMNNWRKFDELSRSARKYREKYIKENNKWEGWYNEYYSSEFFKVGKSMAWAFFNELHQNEVFCCVCKEKIENLNDFVPHHEPPYEYDYIWYVFLNGEEQKIYPCHKKCHRQGALLKQK